jgi:hypothetical protein
MEASREEAVLLLRKWQSAGSEIRCNVIRQPEFVVSLSLKIESIDQPSLLLLGPNDSRISLDLSLAEFEFLDPLALSPDAVIERLVEAILGIVFRDLGLSFILAIRKSN